jgi:hypothetical protein
MFFTLDIWWKRVTREITGHINTKKRLGFLAVGSFSAGCSLFATQIILNDQTYNTFSLLATNWLTLALIAILKFTFLQRMFLTKNFTPR